MQQSENITATKNYQFARKVLLAIAGVAGCAALTAADAGSSLAARAIARAQTVGWTNGGPTAPGIDVKSWNKPQTGWLYILDPQPQAHPLTGRVWLLDPDTAKVMGEVSTGSNPDFALSPDGTRLYVTSEAQGDWSNLAVIDTSNGVVTDTATIEDRVFANGIPPYSSMAVSGDGLALRILVNPPTSPVTDGFVLATFNTRGGGFLPGVVHLGNCGYGRFIDYPSAIQFDFLCPTTNRIRRVQIDAKSGKIDNAFVVIPWERRLGVGQAFLAPGDQDMTIARGDGAIYNMDVATATFAATPVHGDVQGRILPAAWPTSPDGKLLYLGYSSFPNPRFYLDYDRSATLNPRSQTVKEIRVLDTTTWRKVARIKTKAPFWSLTATSDGRWLYALAPESHSILVIDTAKMRQTRSIPIGASPALALIAP